MNEKNLIAAAAFTPDLLQSPSAWLGHLPFSNWVMQEVKPKIFVELGTHYGHSYFAFCQSVVEADLSTKCYAVDTWQGDEHAGQYNDEIFNKVNEYHQEHYAGFSRLLRMTFDDAATHFADESIDLLHIDGLHTYEAVLHDFETWLPKLAPGAVVMLHDTNVRERNFGVWKLWEELQDRYQKKLEFVHSHGLGVFQLNNASVDKKLNWLQCDIDQQQEIKKYFAALGARQQERFDFNVLKQYATSLSQAVSERDAQIVNLKQIIFNRDAQIVNLKQTVVNHDKQIVNLKQTVVNHDKQIASLNRTVDERDVQIDSLNRSAVDRDNVIQQIYSSTSWRLTRPIRAFKSLLLHKSESAATTDATPSSVLTQKIRRIGLIYSLFPAAYRHTGSVSGTFKKIWTIYKREGLNGVKRRIVYLHTKSTQGKAHQDFFDRNGDAKYVETNVALSETDIIALRKEIEQFTVRPLISILVPTYNPRPEWLDKAINSVRNQIYPHWELCIADDASTNPAIRPVLERHSLEDSRIKIVFRETNGNISAASNSALEIASGDYLALLDHDDELSADALYWNVKQICSHPDADVIYSDEDKITPDGKRTDTFFKPDWSPELMFNCMYMGHLTVYKRSLIDQVGGFRSEFDFSQDYDLALRATEVAKEILHIPRILYHWRQADGSAAQGEKPYARVSNLAALQAAVDRRGVKARVIELPTANRVKLIGWRPKVSIVIPTDSEANLITCLDALADKTAYPSWEIIVVTNSKLAKHFTGTNAHLQLAFCCYDKPYNFSDKCNEGALKATGEIVVFFNDDVRPLNPEWLEDLIELLAIPGVGAVSPKLIYEDHRIQHAGLVSGVRGLVGTAFHCLPEATSEYFCFAQSVRNVSALSGACFAMRRQVFIDIGGFDAVNTPIMHSDVDLSFKVREVGLRCVYTPHATLLHIGHLSLSGFDKKQAKDHQDKADIYLLKRWGGYISYDPYFTDNMRGLLYHDSPEMYGMFGENRLELHDNRPDILLVSHDMSASGAPMVVYYAAKQLLNAGFFPVVASPEDGPLRSMFENLGIPVIVDSLLLTRHESVLRLARNFDCIIANTIVSWPIVHQMQSADVGVPVLWYVHECKLIPSLALANPLVENTLRAARHLLAGSKRSLEYCLPFNPKAEVLTYGVADAYVEATSSQRSGPLVFSLFGSIEPRKGQDIFVKAAREMEKLTNVEAVFNVVGRTLDKAWAVRVETDAEDLKSLCFHGEVDHIRYMELMNASDVIVCPSREDTLPLVTLDALSMGKVLICSEATGTSDFLTHGIDGLVVPTEAASFLAEAMSKLVTNPSSAKKIGAEARQTFLRNFSEASFGQRINKLVQTVTG